jgi:hypothetical protein
MDVVPQLEGKVDQESYDVKAPIMALNASQQDHMQRYKNAILDTIFSSEYELNMKGVVSTKPEQLAVGYSKDTAKNLSVKRRGNVRDNGFATVSSQNGYARITQTEQMALPALALNIQKMTFSAHKNFAGVCVKPNFGGRKVEYAMPT